MRPRHVLSVLVLFGCNAAPADRREWRVSDHDHTDNPGANQVVGGPDAGPPPELAQHGLNELTIVTWQQNCVRCHGRIGRGDGPEGPRTRATDLTNPDWQRSVTDDLILKTLREGRGLMPAFPLPDPTLRSLVQLVRLIGKASAEPASSAAPPASGAPRPASAPSARAPASPAPSAPTAPRAP